MKETFVRTFDRGILFQHESDTDLFLLSFWCWNYNGSPPGASIALERERMIELYNAIGKALNQSPRET